MRQSVDLMPEDWRALDELASRTKSAATRGKTVGRPSWRTLLARLARDEAAQRLLVDHWQAKDARPRHELPQSVVLRPPQPVTKTIAWVSTDGDRVRIFQPEKRDDFGTVVKGMGYTWQEPYWERVVPAAALLHRVAETCHRLVAAGFCVVPPNADIAERVIAGDYDQEDRRVIKVISKGEYQGWFAVWWARSEDYYDLAKKITASRYLKPFVVVPPEHYAEVLDFADRYQFTVSPAARRRAAEAESMLMTALLLDLPSEDALVVDDGSIPQLQPVESDIDDELADDLA